MADHDDTSGTMTDDVPVDRPEAEDRSSSENPVGRTRVVRRKPSRFGAVKRRRRAQAPIATLEDPGRDLDEQGDTPPVAARTRPGRRRPGGRLARLASPRSLILLLVLVLAVAFTVTAALQWRGLQDDRSAQSERQAFLQAGRQGALNLTTIRWDNADSDVQRILDGAGDPFRKDFADRSKSFIAVVKEAKSTSIGDINEAGIASVEGNVAQVVVAATVKTSNVGEAEQEPRAWRMKVAVEKKDDRMLVTNVEFVP